MKQYLSYAHSVFEALLLTYLGLVLVNQFTPLVYPTYLNWLLGVVLVLGVVTALTKQEEKITRMKRLDVILVWGLGILGAALVFVKTGTLGWLRYVVTGLSGTLIILLGYVVYAPEEDEKPVYLRLSWVVLGYVICALLILSSVLAFFLGWSAFRIVFGSVAVLFIPGFALSYVFFKRLDVLERLALSFALSIAVVPILVFYLNLVGIRVSAWSVLSVVLFVTLVSIVLARKRFHVRRS